MRILARFRRMSDITLLDGTPRGGLAQANPAGVAARRDEFNNLGHPYITALWYSAAGSHVGSGELLDLNNLTTGWLIPRSARATPATAPPKGCATG
jgi:hypothetical protein